MRISIRDVFRKRTPRGPRSTRAARLTVDALEDRRVPTVTFHGGALLPHVEVQGLYFGSDWSNSSTSYGQQASALDGFLKSVVSGPYLDLLTNAGYGVGRGTSSPGVFDQSALNKSVPLSDAAIRGRIQAAINAGALQAPDANRLYVVFVEDNVVVQDLGVTSQSFHGYHTAFTGTNAQGQQVPIRYAVIAYPGGSNLTNPFLSTLECLTTTASHEIAEAVTDPDQNYRTLGWNDDGLGSEGEIGDIFNQQAVYLNGYAVQRLADTHDQAMTPAGATSSRPVGFVLLSGGNLYEHSSAGWTFVAGGVATVSNQGIDRNSRALVDFVTTGGQAYEYRDGTGLVPLTSGVRDAQAGLGVSYVLLTNGTLLEYADSTDPRQPGQWSTITSGVASIDAGSDRYGVTSVDYVLISGAAYEFSNATGPHFLASGARSVSAGRMGASELLLGNGNAYDYQESTGVSTFLASNVSQVTAGADAAGNAMIDLVLNGGNLYEYRTGSGWTLLTTGTAWVGKARAGVVGVVLTNGNAYERSTTGWTFLTGSAIRAV
jgi:hypothetical protein